MTINELLAVAGLTANDEIPIWDAEATGEPTKKITAANLASAIVTLANLVTGVKGNAESNYRHGNVNLTLSNLGLKSLRLEAGTPMDNGQVDLGLSTNKIPLSVWSTNTVCQFYVRGTTATWWVRLSDRITGAVISGTTTPLPINVMYIDV